MIGRFDRSTGHKWEHSVYATVRKKSWSNPTHQKSRSTIEIRTPPWSIGSNLPTHSIGRRRRLGRTEDGWDVGYFSVGIAAHQILTLLVGTHQHQNKIHSACQWCLFVVNCCPYSVSYWYLQEPEVPAPHTQLVMQNLLWFNTTSI